MLFNINDFLSLLVCIYMCFNDIKHKHFIKHGSLNKFSKI